MQRVPPHRGEGTVNLSVVHGVDPSFGEPPPAVARQAGPGERRRDRGQEAGAAAAEPAGGIRGVQEVCGGHVGGGDRSRRDGHPQDGGWIMIVGSVGLEPSLLVVLDYLTKVQERTAVPQALGSGERVKP